VESKDLRGIVRALIEARIRETDITDGRRVQFGSTDHVSDLENRISDLERWRDRQRRGSEARANYARLISQLKRELRSALRVNDPRPQAVDPTDVDAAAESAPVAPLTSMAAPLESAFAEADEPKKGKKSKKMAEAVDMEDPEYTSIEDFVQFMLDDERDTYTHEDIAALNFRTRMPINSIRKELDGYGFKLASRAPVKQVRGFTSNSHDRWFGKGSMPTHGGAGIDPQTGRATSGRGDI
jgi:hypothetical protein